MMLAVCYARYGISKYSTKTFALLYPMMAHVTQCNGRHTACLNCEEVGIACPGYVQPARQLTISNAIEKTSEVWTSTGEQVSRSVGLATNLAKCRNILIKSIRKVAQPYVFRC